MMITRMALPRRTFLKGLGASVALPLLDSMVPAFTAQAATVANTTEQGREVLRSVLRSLGAGRGVGPVWWRLLGFICRLLARDAARCKGNG